VAAVAKGIILELQLLGPEHRLMGNAAQAENGLKLGHGLNFLAQERVALANFRGHWLVLGGQTAHRIGNSAVVKRHSRISPPAFIQGIGLGSEAELMQSRIKQLPRDVPGKRPPGTVGAPFPGAQAHHQKAAVQGAEGRYGPGMPIRVPLTDGG